MTNGPLRIADVFRAGQSAFLDRYGDQVPSDQRRVLRDIIACRTAAMGGHVKECDECGHCRVFYNSCRNRHCPGCQAGARAAWFDAREAELLPVPYFHVVFTLPQELANVGLQNKRLIYGILFRAASDTLLEVAANPKHLGARIGVLMVLHTWGQNLSVHPHVHCIATGGGISEDGSQWITGRRRNKFFLPIRVLSRVFRGKFVQKLRNARATGELQFQGNLAELADPTRFESFVSSLVRHDWVVYAKRPFGGPRQVLKYLARYTHRVAISDSRLLNLSNDEVTFKYKDYADNSGKKEMTLSTTEFIRRFLMHTLPNGFVRIRYYGFLANRFRRTQIDHVRGLLGCRNEESKLNAPNAGDASLEQECPADICPVCRTGQWLVVERIEAAHRRNPYRPHFSQLIPQPDDGSVEVIHFGLEPASLDTS